MWKYLYLTALLLSSVMACAKLELKADRSKADKRGGTTPGSIDGEGKGTSPSGSQADPNTPVTPKGSLGRMVVIADSIGTGLLADTNLTTGDESVRYVLREYGDKITSLLRRLSREEEPSKDDLKRFYLPGSSGYASTAVDVDWSFPRELEKLGYSFDEVVNKSEAGLTAYSGKEFVDKIEADEASSYDTVFVALGHNDVCGETSVQDLLKNYREFLKVGLDKFSEARFVVTLPANISGIMAHDLTIPVDIPLIGFDISCSSVRRAYCPAMAGTSISVDSKVTALREGIKNLSQELLSERGVSVLSSLEKDQIEATDLSIDCFHPSEDGQKKIAKVLAEEFSQNPPEL